MHRFAADPLSDIIGLLRPHDCVAAGLDAGGDWAVRFKQHAGMKCNAVVEGACTLRVERIATKSGVASWDPIQLTAGDCFILPHGRPFLISADGMTPGTDAEAIYAPVPHGGTAVHNEGGAFFMTGARFLVSGSASGALLGVLPPVLVVRDGARSELVRWVLVRIAAELRAPSPGTALTISHLSHLLLVEVMRQYLMETAAEATGWIAALADPTIARALEAMHANPARRWTVAALASQADMSRTSFAIRFRRIAGQTPMAYLTTWRMLLAADRLQRTDDSIARIAAQVGYSSESAFAHAFRRELGCSPRRYTSER
ncbi:MAG: AraC family transcriptional regulator [Pseudomonadota bacterium]